MHLDAGSAHFVSPSLVNAFLGQQAFANYECRLFGNGIEGEHFRSNANDRTLNCVSDEIRPLRRERF